MDGLVCPCDADFATHLALVHHFTFFGGSQLNFLIVELPHVVGAILTT